MTLRAAGFSMIAVLSLARPARPADPPPAAPGPRAVERLERAWPGHPEWLAMLVDILEGSQLGPSDGWFRAAVAQTRHTWEAARARLDADGDGRVSPAEFAGPAADFARLDRDRDGALTAADFDFSPHALAPSPGMMLFYRADRDGNGKLTPEEFAATFRALDRDGAGFVSLSDLQEAMPMPSTRPRPAPTAPSPAPAASAGPTRSTLLRGLVRQEIGSLSPGPGLGERAPDFTLKAVDTGEPVTLSALIGPRPVVLIFGNFTCGPFRSRAGDVEKLHLRYKDRATFVMVYVREAHPTDGWSMESNDRVGVSIAQPRTEAERGRVASLCRRTLDLDMPMLVDSMSDAVGARYSGMPSRLYLLDRAGTVAYKSGRGPFGFKPAELEQALVLELRAGAPALTAPPRAGAPAP